MIGGLLGSLSVGPGLQVPALNARHICCAPQCIKHVFAGFSHNPVAVPRFPRALTAGMELALVIQNEVARPCAALVANATLVQVGCQHTLPLVVV